MIDFEPLTAEMVPVLKEYFSHCDSRLCDRTLGGAFMWRNCFSTQVAEGNGCLFLSSELETGKRAFTVPLGDFDKGMDLLEAHCAKTGSELVFCSVSEEEKEKILARHPEMIATENRDWFDYLYLAEKMNGFPGKKLSGQRNHLNFFLKNHTDWHFQPIGSEEIPKVKEFFLRMSESIEKESDYYKPEKEAVWEVLDHPDLYGFLGGMIVAEGQIVAFSFGEVVGDTLFVHIEKADRNVRGAYQVMVSEFVSHYATEKVLYVNREEDVGDPGLRYSKESYKPERLLKKYMVTKK